VQLLEVLENYWNFKTKLEILQISWKFVNSPGKIFYWTSILVVVCMAALADK